MKNDIQSTVHINTTAVSTAAQKTDVLPQSVRVLADIFVEEIVKEVSEQVKRHS